MEVVIESERDRRTYEWLVAQVGAEAVSRACQSLAGDRKPFVSNVAKTLGLKPPSDLALASRETAQKHLATMRTILEPKSR